MNNGLRNDTAEVAGSTLSVDLQTHTELNLFVGVYYNVHVRAVNSEGIGPPSEDVEFRRVAGDSGEWLIEYCSLGERSVSGSLSTVVQERGCQVGLQVL